MKLIDILKELERPQRIYNPGMENTPDPKDIMQTGFKLGTPTVDPVTGTSTSNVEYLPEFENLRRQALKMRKEFQAFRFSSNPDIAKTSKDIGTHLTKVSQLIFALDKMIELQRKNK